ncbi:hypothetical protein CcaCcLH18_10751 [Colletotrichum camelliae]|nr:hypothetical protein CcaCcLH18_10751 [Colletotrichum camelliae]
MQSQPARSDVPTRLVDVGEEGDEISPRILLNNEEDPVTEYTTLSYAWGGRGSDIKLTASNISQITKAIDWARLPKTIQEAIIFTRKLGVRYIWIDALCIMQSTEPDDIAAQDDWHREAERFGRYYRNSLLTIAATGVADSAGGLFLPRPALVFQPQPLTLQRRTAEGTLTPMTIFPSMPTRVVHFATNCVLWECGGLGATEVYPEGLHPEDESHGWLGSWMFDEFRRLDDHDVGSVLNGWYSFVEHYTRTNFTYQLDRLPALASLAEIVHERIGRDRRYLAGIWEVDISVGLSWGAWGPFLWDPPGHGKEHMGERDSVPSWSWASARGGVSFLFYEGREWDPLLEVEFCDVELGGGDMIGRLSQPRLRLTGKFATKDLSSLGFIELAGSRWHNAFGGPRHNTDEYSGVHVLKLDSRQSKDFILGPYACLLVGASHFVNEDGIEWVGGALILESTGYALDGIEEFRRIGFLSLSLQEHWSDVETYRTIDLV